MKAEGSNKRRRKGKISQEDIYPVLQRYSVTTVITLLKEISQFAEKKIDWNELVKKTATGITNAREYQMLWRHLAYCDPLEEKVDEAAVPMDDESDIEFELEASPPISNDASTKVAACVKVLIASASLVNGNASSAVEAPLSISIPSGWSSNCATEKPLLQETNTTISVLVPKQPVSLPSVASIEGLDAIEAGSGNVPPRRRRKGWSREEDDELTAAVERIGEGNWANMLKGEFKGDRTPSQLSQRWAIIKKQKKNSNVKVSSQTTDLSAVRKAFNMALDMPMMESKPILLNGKGGSSPNTIITPSNSSRSTVGESSQSQHHRQQDPEPATSLKSRFMNPIKPSPSPALSPDAIVKAAAFAAGARIATPSDAATLLKAAQSKKAVHIIPSGPSSIKSSGPSNFNSLPPNVHFFGRAVVNRSTSGLNNVTSNASRPGGTPQAQSQTTRPSHPTAQINPTQIANESNFSREKVHGDLKSKANMSISDDASDINNEVKTDVTSIGAGSGSEKSKENKVIEMHVERERENKSTPEEKRTENGGGE